MKPVVIAICFFIAGIGGGYALSKYKHRSEVKLKISDEITRLNYEANEKLQIKIDALFLDDVDDERLHAITDSLAGEFARKFPAADFKREDKRP
jgi:carbon monoxide dehydrogenase subunit G